MKKLCLSLSLILCLSANAFCQEIDASFSSSVYDKPFTGKVIVYLSKENKEPKDGDVGIEKFPCFSVDAKNVKPGEAIVINDSATSYPTRLSDIERGEYYVQVVWDRNLGGRSIAMSPGNLLNPAIKINLTHDLDKKFTIVATEKIPDPSPFSETDYIKQLKVPSKLLSDFQHKPMTVDAAVMLPKEYLTEPDRKFPVLFMVSGYGGDYHQLSAYPKPGRDVDSIPFITVFLDGNCPLGHSVYANSVNNGPWGDALTSEFIPALENQFRCNGAHLLTGHSSGGWTVLWLQTHYPKVFDGCWSSSPDPVDFRRFQKINLYEDENMFYDADSALRSVATVAGRIPWASMKDFYQMENVVYRGEQMHSFDAVFSDKGIDGNPQTICNPITGEIDTTVFAHWKQYDISLYLRENWDKLNGDLDGKVRVSVGKQDNFLLNYAVALLETEMKNLGSSFEFEYYPGDHFTVFTKEYQQDGNAFLKMKYQDWLAKNARREK